MFSADQVAERWTASPLPKRPPHSASLKATVALPPWCSFCSAHRRGGGIDAAPRGGIGPDLPGCSDHQESRHHPHLEAVGLGVANDNVDVAGLDDDWLILRLALPIDGNIIVDPGMARPAARDEQEDLAFVANKKVAHEQCSCG